jgi:hypothetical protein
MRLSNGYINRRPLMERDGSGVSALVGLDGFVVRAQLLEESTGEWWLAVETTDGLRRARGGPWPALGGGSGPPARGSAGRAGVVQAPVALPGAGVPGDAHRTGRASPQSVEASPMRSGDARDTTEVRPRVP